MTLILLHLLKTLKINFMAVIITVWGFNRSGPNWNHLFIRRGITIKKKKNIITRQDFKCVIILYISKSWSHRLHRENGITLSILIFFSSSGNLSHYSVMSESKSTEGGYIIGDVPMAGLRNSFFPARKECECWPTQHVSIWWTRKPKKKPERKKTA